MTRDDAIEVAKRFVATLEKEAGIPLSIIMDATIERSFGWVFFYNSRPYIEHGDFSSALAGNAPFVVRRSDGKVIETGTAEPLERYLEGLVKQGQL